MTLQEAKLLLELGKCVFYRKEVNFLGYVITTKGIKINLDKINIVLN